MKKNFVSTIWKKISKCKSVWEKIFYVLFEKNFLSVKVYEKKNFLSTIWKKICKCKSVWGKNF